MRAFVLSISGPTGMSVGTDAWFTGAKTFNRILFDTVFGHTVLALLEMVPKYSGFDSSSPTTRRGKYTTANLSGLRSQATAATADRLIRFWAHFISEIFTQGRMVRAMKFVAADFIIVIRPFEPAVTIVIPSWVSFPRNRSIAGNFRVRLFKLCK